MMVIGQRRGEGGQQVDRFALRKAVDQVVGQRLDARPQPLDLPRDEGAVDQRAQPRVDGRLELQHGIGLDRVESRRDGGGPVRCRGCRECPAGLLPAEAPVAQQAADVVETAKAPEAELLPEECAALAVQPGIGLVGVLDERFLVRIEPQAGGSRRRRRGRAVAASWRSCWIISAPCQRDARPTEVRAKRSAIARRRSPHSRSAGCGRKRSEPVRLAAGRPCTRWRRHPIYGTTIQNRFCPICPHTPAPESQPQWPSLKGQR